MKIVAVAINKGGTGKTTTSKSIATAAAAGGYNVLLLDMDGQENARKWGSRRKERNPYKICRSSNSRRKRACPTNSNRLNAPAAIWW